MTKTYQIIIAGLFLLLGLAATPRATAQTAFELHPFEIPGLGMTVRLPEDSTVDIRRIMGGESLVVIQLNQRTSIRLRNFVSRDSTISASDVLDEIVRQRQEIWQAQIKDDPNGRQLTRARFYDRVDNLEISGRKASRVYMDVPADPKIETAGFTILEPAGRREARADGTMPQFIVCELRALPPNINDAIQSYETVLATAEFRDPSEMKAERFAAIEMAQAFLNQVTANDLKTVLDQSPRFYRVYRPAPGGLPSDADEIAYQRIHLRLGHRGDLEPDRPRHLWREGDLEEGLIAQVDGRFLSGATVVDLRAIYFLSFDRKHEVWSIVNVAKQGNRSDHSTQTLVRDENGITVTTTSAGEEPRVRKWRKLPRGYISKVELYLLPRLIAMKNIPGAYGFYAYDPQLDKLTFRTEDFAMHGDAHWTQDTVLTVNTDPVRTMLDAAGGIVSKEMGNGTLMEPSSRERLKRIWDQKNKVLGIE